MKVADIELEEVRRRLRSGNLALKIGGFQVCIKSSLPQIAEEIHSLYQAYPVAEQPELADFHVELSAPSLLRRFFRPQVQFSYDGFVPFKPLPQSQAFAMFEWGLNWCVANGAHQFLIVHAAVVELNGKAFIFPGTPGSGKSTLCAALVSRGWRLLSDEMALIAIENGKIVPIPRPISLKNQSISIMRDFSEQVYIGKEVRDTAKGTIGHMRVSHDNVAASGREASAAVIVFPKYRAGAETDLVPISRGKAFIEIARNSFNYHVLGVEGFELLVDVLQSCDCYEFSYQSLNEAVNTIDGIFEGLASDAA